VTCLDVDASGSRLISGSLDYTVRMFDFSGMKSDLRSFRCVVRMRTCQGLTRLVVLGSFIAMRQLVWMCISSAEAGREYGLQPRPYRKVQGASCAGSASK
jgi:hypothetical protein